MDKFLKEYDGHRFEDWHTKCSDDFKSFARKFKNYLKRAVPNTEIIGWDRNHYDCCGFVKRDGKYVFVSYTWDRRNPVDIENPQAVLCRTAKNEKDFHGGWNNLCSFEEMADTIERLLK